MFQPSAMRDRFIFVATNALHLIALAREPAREDELLGDPDPKTLRWRYPTRKQKEVQLHALAQDWEAGEAFMNALSAIDDKAHQDLTSDFRNRASHAIAPRFSVGITRVVVRERGRATTMEKQPDGKYLDVPVPGKMATSYGYGGTPPLGMEDARTANLAQFEAAKRCFFAYVELLREATAKMPQRRPDASDQPV
jgi:hypothetical protein